MTGPGAVHTALRRHDEPQEHLDFNKYLQQATDQEKEEYAKAVLGDSRGKQLFHSLVEAEQQVVVRKKTMLTSLQRATRNSLQQIWVA